MTSSPPFYLYKFNCSDKKQQEDYQIFPTPSSINTNTLTNNYLNYGTSGDIIAFGSMGTNSIELPPISSIPHFYDIPLNLSSIGSISAIEKSVSTNKIQTESSSEFVNNNEDIDKETDDDEHYADSIPAKTREAVKCPYSDCRYPGIFSSRDYLRRHIREQHTEIKLHYCMGIDADGSTWGCSKCFKRPYQLTNHWKGKRSLKKCRVPKKILLQIGIDV